MAGEHSAYVQRIAKQALCQLSYIPMLTCSFASHRASCTVA